MVQRQEPIIRLQHICKDYKLFDTSANSLFRLIFPFAKLRHKLHRALRDINLEVNRGEIVGVIGPNGSGKSTLLRLVAGITAPSSGLIETKGRTVPLFELGAGFHRDLTGRENLHYYTVMQGFDENQASGMIEQAIAFADIGPFIDQPLKFYSRGMRSRLAFSISVFVEADILVIDEVLAVGDARFKMKSHAKMRELLTSGKTILFVSHSEREILKVCTRALLIKNGKIIQDGQPQEVVSAYRKSTKGKREKTRRSSPGNTTTSLES